MSTTLNKLEYLDETKKQIKTALNQFGAGITDETTFREYADKIDDIYDNWEKVTAENTAITLDNTKAGLMKAELKGNTEQDGTPTPAEPVPIQVVKGSNSVTIANSDNSQSQNYTITLPTGMELCKIGDYQDYIYKSGDNWFLEKKVEKIVLDGTEDWVVYGSASEEYVRYSIALSKRYITDIGLSNILTENESKVYGKNGIAFWIYLNQLRVCVSLTEFPDVASFKNFLLTTNMIAYIVLENPTTTPITDTTLINQLNAIEENLKSYNDQTNILQTNDDLPFIINASALKKGGN